MSAELLQRARDGTRDERGHVRELRGSFPGPVVKLLAPNDVLIYGHILMLIFVLVIMLWRRQVYVAAHGH
jgi:hypothetical protein